MRTPWKILAPALIAASVPLMAGSAGAAPLSPSLKNADAVLSVETVQWRRGHRGRWIGPGAGFAAGVVGSALAPRYYDYGYNGGYGAYAYSPGYTYDPGYAYVPARRYYRNNYGGRGCTGDDSFDSSYPSWYCR